MTCILIVKSDTTLIDKKEFENWYSNEHISEAKRAFMAKNAKRGWIKIQISVLPYMNLKTMRMLKKQLIQKI